MTPAWMAALFGLLGAVVGAGATLIANWISARAQVRVAADERRQKLAEIRRGACADYLVVVDAFLDHAREVVANLDGNAAEADLEAAYSVYGTSWADLQRKCAPVVIAGPAELGDRADGLKGQLGAVADVCDAWYTARKDGYSRSRDAKFVSARDVARQDRAAFVAAAQQHALPDPGRPA